jgi:epoxide hydrolase-like predicted phosphatase
MQKTTEIKNIIFDLGNVLIPLELEKVSKAFLELMPEGTTSANISTFTSLDSFTDFETGKISAHGFIQSLKPSFNEGVTREEIVEAWNTILGEFPRVHTEMLKKLSGKYRLFVLSNTNEIHAAKYEKEVPGANHLKDLFEKLYYSHIHGLRKPQPEFFNLLLRQNDLNPKQTLFADDLPENIQTAKNLGLQTLLVTPEIILPRYFSTFYR